MESSKMQLTDDDTSTIFYDAIEEQISLLSRSKSDDDEESDPTDGRSMGYSRCAHDHDKEDRASEEQTPEQSGPPQRIKFMSTPTKNGSHASDGDVAPEVPVRIRKRSAKWFDEETSVDPPSPPPGHSPSSAFDLHTYSPRLHGCNGQAVSLSLPEIEREHGTHALQAQSNQMDGPLNDPASWRHSTSVNEYSESSNEEDQKERDYGFFAIVHCDSNVLSDVSMTSPAPPNSLEKAPSVDSAYNVMSAVSQLEDSISPQIRSPPRWLPSPLSTGSASTRRQKGKRDLTKGHTGGSERGGVDRWTPRALFRKSPSSAQQRTSRKAEDDKARNVTRTSTTSSTDDSEEELRSNSCGSSPFDDTNMNMNDNPFIIADGEEIDTANYPDKGGIIRELDDGGIECQLFPSQDDLLGEEPKQAINDSDQSPNTEGSHDSPTTFLDANQHRFPDNHRRYRITPRKLFGELSPRLKSPLKRKMTKKDVFTPLDVLPTNAVSVQGSRDGRKSAATSASDPLLLINSITMAHAGPIWRMEFSHDGKYLATGGEDGLLSIYEVAPKKAKPLSRPCPTAAALAEWEAAQGAPPPTDPLGAGPPLGCEVNVLSSKPLRRYREHAGDIVDMCWSKTNFLLTASLDKTVRLWHVSRKTCLHSFRHKDAVTSVDFHPSDDRFFVSGSFDRKIRVWDITTARVTEWAQTRDVVSAVKYTPNEKFVVAGLFHGQVVFYTSVGLKYYTQISAKNKHGRTRRGCKVTGLAFLRTKNEELHEDGGLATFLKAIAGLPASALSPLGREDDDDSTSTADNIESTSANNSERKRRFRAVSSKIVKQAKNLNISPRIMKNALAIVRNRGERDALLFKEKILVTTNDSRLRLFGLDDYCMMKKYQGGTNTSLQIKARISESGEYILSGSDTGGMVHVWQTSAHSRTVSIDSKGIHRHEKCRSCESFRATTANPSVITDAHFIPSNVLKRALKESGLFPTLSTDLFGSLDHDFSSSAVITCDYEGTIRILLRKKILDDAIRAAGPEGNHTI